MTDKYFREQTIREQLFAINNHNAHFIRLCVKNNNTTIYSQFARAKSRLEQRNAYLKMYYVKDRLKELLSRLKA